MSNVYPPPNAYEMQNQPQYGGGPPQFNGHGYSQPNGYGNGQPQPQYGSPPPVPPHPQPQDPKFGANFDGPPPTYDEAFKIEKPKYNDWWAGVLFLLTCAGFIAVSAFSIYKAVGNVRGGLYSTSMFGLTAGTIYLFLFVLVTAFVLSLAYVWLARQFTKAFIWITGILSILMTVGTSLYYLSQRYFSGGLVFLMFAVFQILFYITCRKRIPFTVVMLETAVDVSRRFGHVYIISAVGGLLATAFGAWFAVTLVAISAGFQGAENSNGKFIGLVCFIVFASYWITEWLKNTVHTTVSGVYGSWYYNSQRFPRKVTRGALRRSLTYSFGSISLGSLVVAIVNTLRQLASIGQQQASQEGDLLATCCFCFLSCLIGMLQWVVEFVNRYAFSHIALYGKPYFAAAKDTWKMIKDRGMEALINDCLIGPVFTFGATFVAYSCALLAYCYVRFTDKADSSKTDHLSPYLPLIVAFSFLIGLQVCNIFTTPLSSGIDTLFVAMAWDPEVMMRDHPDLYLRLVAAYPQVQEAIHA